MKTILLIIAVICLILMFTGCATTRLTVMTPDSYVQLELPKNMHAKNLVIKAGEYELTAEELTTDASSVVTAKGKITSDVAGAVAPVLTLLK